MVLEYIAYNPNGEKVAGTLEVSSFGSAREVLWQSGLIIVKLRKRRIGYSLDQLLPSLFGVKDKDIISYNSQLSYLLDSGLSLAQSLRILSNQAGKKALKKTCDLLLRDIQQGKSFSQACAGQRSIFNESYVHMIEVAEQAGEISKMLVEIASFMQRQRNIIAKIKKSITYPIIVISIGILAGYLLITVSLPALTKLLKEYGANLPLATRILLNMGDIIQAYGVPIFIGVVTLISLLWLYARIPRGRKMWDSAILRIPIIGNIINSSQMLRLCSNLTSLLEAGMTITKSIMLSIEVMDNAIFRQGLSAAYRDVQTGMKLNIAIKRQKIFPQLLSDVIGIGEETGNVKVNIKGLANYYEQETTRLTTQATDLIEPVIVIIVGIFVGFIGIAIMSAIYSIIPQIG